MSYHKAQNRDIRALLARCVEQGCRISGGGSKHYMVMIPNGRIVVLPTSPSRAGLQGAKKQLKRAGIQP